MIHLRAMAALAILLLSGCALTPPLQPGQAELKGYSAVCHGSIRIQNGPNWELRVAVPAGPQTVTLEYVSEPTMPDVYPGPRNYLCSSVSLHRVSFTAEPGRSYRFDARREGPTAVITAYEVYDPPNARPVPTTSMQEAVRQQCSFFAPQLDCGP